jgi:hypothetical protein
MGRNQSVKPPEVIAQAVQRLQIQILNHPGIRQTDRKSMLSALTEVYTRIMGMEGGDVPPTD